MLSTATTTINENLWHVDYTIILELQRELKGILTHLICSETIILCLHEGKTAGVRQLPLHGEGGARYQHVERFFVKDQWAIKVVHYQSLVVLLGSLKM